MRYKICIKYNAIKCNNKRLYNMHKTLCQRKSPTTLIHGHRQLYPNSCHLINSFLYCAGLLCISTVFISDNI